MCGPMVLMGLTLASGAMSAVGSIQAGKAQAQGHALQSEELGKQIRAAEIQSADEELQRRRDNEYLTSQPHGCCRKL